MRNSLSSKYTRCKISEKEKVSLLRKVTRAANNLLDSRKRVSSGNNILFYYPEPPNPRTPEPPAFLWLIVPASTVTRVHLGFLKPYTSTRHIAPVYPYPRARVYVYVCVRVHARIHAMLCLGFHLHDGPSRLRLANYLHRPGPIILVQIRKSGKMFFLSPGPGLIRYAFT